MAIAAQFGVALFLPLASPEIATMNKLVERLQEPRRWVYVVGAVPFVFAALYGWHAGAAIPYLVIGLLCAAQFFHPTRLAWWTFSSGYVAITLFYGYLLIADLYRLAQGSVARILTDASDATGYIVWIAALVLITWMFWNMPATRPMPHSD